MSFPRYPDYKDSGVEWLGAVPAHWEVDRLKRQCAVMPSNVDKKSYAGEQDVRLCNYTDVYYNDRIVATMSFMEATASAEQIKRFALRVGDVIITKDSETADDIAVSAVVEEDLPGVVCGYHLALLRPNNHTSGGFLKYLFDSKITKAQVGMRANGLTRVGLSQYALDSLYVAVPPKKEQERIAAFLDRETAKIDALVAEQEQLITLLKEKRQAVISHAVTKGLNPDAPMKDSGVEWLGEVPAHWAMQRLRRISPALTVGIVVNPSSFTRDEGLPFIYGGDIREGAIDWSNARRISVEDSAYHEKTRLEADDLLTVRVGAPGVTAVVPNACAGGNCASVMHIRRGNFNSEWLCLAMNSRVVRYQVEVVQYGAAQEQFNISHAVEFFIPTPPRSEQDAIAAAVGATCDQLNALVDSAQSAIGLLSERRAALITAAVTGQIDVRGLASAEAA